MPSFSVLPSVFSLASTADVIHDTKIIYYCSVQFAQYRIMLCILQWFLPQMQAL